MASPGVFKPNRTVERDFGDSSVAAVEVQQGTDFAVQDKCDGIEEDGFIHARANARFLASMSVFIRRAMFLPRIIALSSRVICG